MTRVVPPGRYGGAMFQALVLSYLALGEPRPDPSSPAPGPEEGAPEAPVLPPPQEDDFTPGLRVPEKGDR